MLRKKSKAIPEGNGPTPQDAFVMITREELRRVLSESIGKCFREFKGDFIQKDRSACSKPRARHSVATSHHGGRRDGRRDGRHEELRVHGGRRC